MLVLKTRMNGLKGELLFKVIQSTKH